ncbi:MAG: ribonuclease HI [Bacteroidales bacterium]|nr:ribonuclease HI [Bacteroidales bacterium]
MTKPKIEIYTDGAARGNPGPGGYGIVLISGKHRKELSEGFRKTTNNRMELLAVIVALETLKIENSDVNIYTDSKYVSESVNQDWISGWIKKSFKKVKNPDLWKRLINIYKLHNVKFIWVKGHSDNEENNRCDYLAVEASKKLNPLIDQYYEEISQEDNKLL